MSTILLSEAKNYLDVIHDEDDAKLQMLLDSAESEALCYMDKEEFGEDCSSSSEVSSEVVIPFDVKLGVLLLLQANYQARPDEAAELRKIAEIKLFPHRCRLGV